MFRLRLAGLLIGAAGLAPAITPAQSQPGPAPLITAPPPLTSAPAPLLTAPPVPASASVRALEGDLALERQVMVIADLLRCLVCQNQTIADSNAELATDLKQQIREQLRQGRSEAQIMQFMVERYGDFVLYKPPLNAATVALWFGPAVLAVAAAIGVIVLVRRRRAVAVPMLSQDDLRAADVLLADPSRPRL